MATNLELDEDFLRILAQLAPGTMLREALDNIVDMGHGGLLLIASEEQARQVVRSGFELHARLTPQRLVELSKMDGAIIIDEDLGEILWANAFLVPDPDLPSEETGTRHMAASRVAQQLHRPTIAVSASRGRISLYYGSRKYVLGDINTLSAKANQALRILEQYRATFDDLTRELTSLELEERVLPDHIANIIQNIVQMLETEEEVQRIFVELGTERELMQLLLDWLMLDVREDFELIIRDFQAPGFQQTPEEIIAEIRVLPSEDLLNTERLMAILGYEAGESWLDEAIPSRGFQVLSQIPRIPMAVIERLVKEFGTLQNIMHASEEELRGIKGIAQVRARAIRTGLMRLRSSLLLIDEGELID
ncbi:MAG TPA: DNA integrity scanning protein DisA [Candidatus Fraserbacteria bacterium]|nr:DNA integrity scanning protein DisA [Candidatus Fraserbacteria bacterium]